MSDKNKRTPEFISPLTDEGEKIKRRREILAVLILSGLFILLTWVELRLFETSKSLPFVHSIFFFGLVNFNIILFLLLTFFIFRNIVKVFTERRDGIFGGALKGKLIAAFVSFSVIPTLLMFLISVFYINNSFDKWFSEKVTGVLKSSLEITNAYYTSAKKNNYHFADQIADKINPNWSDGRIQTELDKLQKLYRLDAVEFYPDLFSERIIAVSKDGGVPDVPEVSLEFKKKGLVSKAESSTIHHYGKGNLIRVIVPVEKASGGIVVSSFISLSLLAKMDDIASAYQDFRSDNPIEYPIKAIYLIILFLMTLTILLSAIWFGFYLAKQLSVPLQILGEATRKVAKGDYHKVEITTGQNEINELIKNFNAMSGTLKTNQAELSLTNKTLRSTLNELDKHSRYIEVVLSSVSTGVVSVDSMGLVTMVNHRAEELLGVRAKDLIDHPIKDVLPAYYDVFKSLYDKLDASKLFVVDKQFEINVFGKKLPIQMTASYLLGEDDVELGTVFVFDDLTDVVRAQRSAAWSEVASRIAHEIKNPLTPIKLAAERLQKKFGSEISDKAFKDCTAMIVEQVDDLKTLVNEFGDFARLPHTKRVKTNLNNSIEQALTLFQFSQKNVSIRFEQDKSLPNFNFDPDQMKRVFTNLINNSISALEGEDQAEISLSTKYDLEADVVRVEFVDNGPGISADILDRVFEPYVTTKVHGTGLGLAIVKRTVEEHGGSISAYNNPPTGVRILIELPVMNLSLVNENEKINKQGPQL